MKPVTQTTFGGREDPLAEQGNCLAACIAAILELPLNEVDYLVGLKTINQLNALWWPRLVEWCARRGLVPLYYPASRDAPYKYAYGPPGLHYIVCGQSPRDLGHAVVFRDDEMVHDPHPKGGGLESVDGYIVLAYKG